MHILYNQQISTNIIFLIRLCGEKMLEADRAQLLLQEAAHKHSQ